MTELEKHLIKVNKQIVNQLETALSQNQELIDDVKRLNEAIRLLTQRAFGSSSEQTPSNQLSLFEEDSEPFNEGETTPLEQTVDETITYKRKKPRGRKAELTKDLPTDYHVCDLSEAERTCDCCQHDLTYIGKREVRTEVEFIPAHMIKHVYQETAYECLQCKHHGERAQIKRGQSPRPVIANSLASPSILAWLCHQKNEMSLPFYRQEKEWERYGLKVSRQTLTNWYMAGALDWLAPIYKSLKTWFLKEEVAHADETFGQILQRSDGKPATSQAYTWLFCTGQHATHPIFLYESSLTRAKSVPETFLTDYSGYLHCDGYAVYETLTDITPAFCLAHVRRKFHEIATHSAYAKTCLSLCNEAFKIERELQRYGPEKRLEKRHTFLLPVYEELWGRLTSLPPLIKGAFKTAVTYALKRKEGLMRVFEDGRLEVSNNRAERAIRPLVVGRKNAYFSTSERGAEATAIVYSLVETAKANGLDTYEYLKYLFERLPQLPIHQQPELVEAFLPWQPQVQSALIK